MSKEHPQAESHVKEVRISKDFAELISEFLFRWRRMIFISVLVIILGVVSWGIYTAIDSQRNQKTALAVYELRKAFQDWKDAHPADLLTAAKNLKQQGSDESLDIDEKTQQKRTETEQALTELLQKSAANSQKNIKAWAYWIQALKARHLEKNADYQTALKNIIALNDKTFHKLAALHLAGALYSEGKTDEAVALWSNLADADDPNPEQIVASVYLGNYFARSGHKEEAIRYWQQVLSLGNELLQTNGLDDEKSFLGGENQIAGSFRSALKQWQIMAENQLLFLESEKIQVAADSYDETIEPTPEQVEETLANPAEQTISFTTDANGNIPSNALDSGTLPKTKSAKP